MILPEIIIGENMSNQTQNKVKTASWLKYGLIGALLLLAPITLISQIVLPIATA